MWVEVDHDPDGHVISISTALLDVPVGKDVPFALGLDAEPVDASPDSGSVSVRIVGDGLTLERASRTLAP
ncbi:MAG: hypothetical protein ACI8PZ_004960 [Myxococcota bacterium]